MSPVVFPSTTSTKCFSNFLRNRDHLVCILMNSGFDPRALRFQRHIGPSMLCTLGSLTRELNLRHFTARGIFGMFMQEVFLHFHLQLAQALICGSILSILNLLCCFFLWFCTRVQQRREVVTWRTSRQEVRDALDPAHAGVLPCHLQG